MHFIKTYVLPVLPAAPRMIVSACYFSCGDVVFACECLAALKSGHVGDRVTRALPVDITRVPCALIVWARI